MPYPERHSQQDQTRKAVEQLAYRLWRDAGHPENLSLHFWQEAEMVLVVGAKEVARHLEEKDWKSLAS